MKHFDDLTKIDVPWGELDRDTKDRLTECKFIERMSKDGNYWFMLECLPSYFKDVCYRKQKPTPMTRQQVLEIYNIVVTEDRKG